MKSRTPNNVNSAPSVTRLYLTFGELGASIYESQVVSQVSFLNTHGFEIDLLGFYSPRRLLNRESRHLLRETSRRFYRQGGGTITLLPHFPSKRLWRCNTPILRRHITKQNVSTVIARGPIATNLALEVRKRRGAVRVIYDCRGAVTEEYREYGAGALSIPSVEVLERRAVVESDGVICVSHALRKYIRSAYGRNDGVVVVPCCVDTHRFKYCPMARHEIRRSLDVENRRVLAFSGSMAVWQCFPDVARLAKRLISEDSRFVFLVMTKEQDTAKSVLGSLEFTDRDYRLLCVEHAYVPDYLSAADVGVVYRHSTLTNRVASPVKIAEYLSTGLPVAISPGIGDYSDLIASRRLGAVINPADLESPSTLHGKIVALLETDRGRIASESTELLRREAYLHQYAAVLQSSMEPTES